MVVKHRRGTTLEWQEVNLDLIPEAGELVLEECLDGTIKCKIGTGYTRFSELPYIDEKTRSDLRAEIAAVKKDCRSKISELSSELITDLGDMEVKLNAIKASQTSQESDYIARDATVKADLERRLNTTTSTLTGSIENVVTSANNTKTTLQNEISRVENRVVSAEKQLKTDIQKCADDFEIKLGGLTSDYVTKDTQVKTELTRSLASAVSTLTADYTDKYNQVKDDLDELDDIVSSNTAKINAATRRISSLVVPDTSSSLTRDAEVIDIRTDYKGNPHATAGDAVRIIGDDLINLDSKVNSLRDSLSQYINTQAIDGLYYDKEGEVGLGQPYYLYLTSDDKVIQGSGVQIIGGAGGGPGGGGSSSLKINFLPGEGAELKTVAGAKVLIGFVFDGTDSSGDIISSASATWRINGVVAEYGTVKSGENYFDATKYIKPGTTKVHLTVNDDTGSATTKTWSVQSIELSLTSDFNDKRKYPELGKDKVIFDFKPTGAVRKTAFFKLDNTELDPMIIEKDVSGTPVSYELPVMTHGAHLLEVYLQADINDTDTVKTDPIYKDIIWFDRNSEVPVIGTTVKELKVKQYTTSNIVYTVYDPKNDLPTVSIEVDGIVVSTQTIQPNKDYDNTPTAVYPYVATTVGAHTVKILCGTTVKTINVSVESIGVNIQPVTTGLAFDFNPATKTNAAVVDNEVIINDKVKLIASENFDWINGGFIPEDSDGPCFCIKAGSTATIDYKLFANEARVSGKEFKLVFKTKNVARPDAKFLHCIDNTTEKDHVGINMHAHNATIYGKDVSLDLAYSEEDVIEFEFNISRDSESIPMVMGYEDGVPSRPVVYNTSSSSFQQNSAKVITLGSEDCDLYIYRLKVYDTSLSASEILRNFIADARTPEEMIDRHNRNQIYDENQNLTPETLAEKCPWLRVYKVSAPHFTNSKSDKVSDTTIQQIYHGGDKILDNWICYKAQHSGQGTSSNNYGAAGRNLDFIMNKDDAYFELGDGSRPADNKITLTRTSIPVAYLNAKVNIASSNNITNAKLAERFNRFNPYERPFASSQIINTGEKDTNGNDIIIKPKDTMEFYNCVIFIQETDPDITTHREFADNDWHFYAIGNIGDSKKTDNTRLTDPSDALECCVEIMDVDLPLSAFPRDTMINAMGYKVDEKTNEPVYTWAKDSNLGILYEKQEDGTYVLTEDTAIDFNKTYYVDILLHDDFSEDFTYGWRYISNKKDAATVAACKQAWIDFYRFVTTSTDEEFKANLKDYFVVDSALYYYLFTTRYCMVDNRAKNTFWHYGKTVDGTHKWDLNWDYDNDTSLGLNNFGKQLYRYGLEDIDVDTAGKEVFRQSNSLFFGRIRDLFSEELKAMYQSLESNDAWNASTLINECDTLQNQFPEELWRVDIERKYIRTYNKSFINGAGDTQFLVNMANGRMKYHRRQWERGQETYMASKYQTPTALGDAYHANFRAAKFEDTELAGLAITPNYEFTLTPYDYMYLNVYYNAGSPISVRVTDQNINTPVTVPYDRDKADIINVGSASAICDFGDLAPIYADTISVTNATRIKSLKIGDDNSEYDNKALSTFTTGDNRLLETLILTNVSGLDTPQDYRKLVNLKELYAFGTNIPSITFAPGGKLEYAELPAVTTLELNNLKYLTDASLKIAGVEDSSGQMTYPSIVDLTIEDCDGITALSLLEACPNVVNVKINNIAFGTKTYTYFEENIFNLLGFEGETSNAKLTGTVHFDTLDGDQFNEIKRRYPNLTVTYSALNSIIKFMDTDKETVLTPEENQNYNRDSAHKIDCTNINEAENVEDRVSIVPSSVTEKAASAEFSYVLFGWSTNENEPAVNYEQYAEGEAILAEAADHKKYNEDMLTNIEGDRTFYPVFKAVRRNYSVQFIGENNEVLKTISIPYGSKVPASEYSSLLQEDSESYDAPGLYKFTGWQPAPESTTIVGDTGFQAQFVEDELGLHEITYTTDVSRKIMSITGCLNIFNDAVTIPSKYTINNQDYTVTSIGGFGNSNSHIAYTNLSQIKLPDYLSELAAYAFANCISLQQITIPAGVTKLSSNAFMGCKNLTSVTIDGVIDTIDATCFHQCEQLSSINLESGLETINSFAFARCAFTDITIPDTVTHIGDTAFGNMSGLKSITITGRAILDKVVNDPENGKNHFHSKAFVNTSPELEIRVPWTEAEHNEAFGYCNGRFGAPDTAKIICSDTQITED